MPITFHFLHPYSSYFRARGWDVVGITGAGQMPEQIGDGLSAVHRVGWDRAPARWRNVKAVSSVRRLLLSENVDVVHTHTPVASLVTRLAVASVRPRSRPAVVYTAHGFHFHPRGRRLANAAYVLAERLLGHWTDRLIVINETDLRAARRLRIVPPDRLSMHRGIGLDLGHYRSTPQLRAEAQRFRDSLSLAADAELLTMVAEMVPRKNHRVAIAAMARARRTGWLGHLVLAGAGPLEPELRRLIGDLRLDDHVTLLGSVDDVRPLLLASSALVLPSRQEGLSRAVMEALALGVPVIGGRSRGVTELVGRYGGVLVDPDDVAALAAAFTGIHLHPRGQELVDRVDGLLEELSIDVLLALHETLYDELLIHRGQR